MESIKKFYPAGIILLLFLTQAVFFWTAEIRLILDLLPDDAAYYFRIAENFSRGYGFSFDTIHQTNGFQPLWEYVLITLYLIYPPEPETAYRLVLILQLVIVSVSAVMLFYSVKKSRGEVKALVSLGIMLLLVYLQAVNGMESALIVLLPVLLYNNSFDSPGKVLTAGMLCGLLVLARTDLIPLPFILPVLLLLNSEMRKAALFFAGAMLPVLPCLITNYVSTGYLLPVSSVLKSGFPYIHFNIDTEFTVTGMISVFSAVPVALYYIIKKREKGDYHHLLLAGFSAAVLIHFIFYSLFIKWNAQNYYFIFYGIYLALVISEFRPVKIYPGLLRIIPLAVLLLLAAKTIWRRIKTLMEAGTQVVLDAAVWARENTRPADVFAMKDAGNFSFLSGRPVINLDGVVNDFYFQEVLNKKRLKLYLAANHVSYYSLYEPSPGKELASGTYKNYSESFISYKYMTRSDRLIFPRENERYRKHLASGAMIVIWEVRN